MCRSQAPPLRIPATPPILCAFCTSREAASASVSPKWMLPCNWAQDKSRGATTWPLLMWHIGKCRHGLPAGSAVNGKSQADYKQGTAGWTFLIYIITTPP
ncbi:hypothetical protein XENTR_v10019310 [Xenopus tropicalis]|nr:hypothetical protein XENTR_v10019310 [Xenopus tropicalis]